MTGYESLRRLAHEHLLPALERFLVLASRLRGLSKFQVSNNGLGLSTQDFDRVIDTVACLQLLAHRILIISGCELRQFLAFSAWLRQEINTQASDSSDSEILDPGASVDHASTLAYIQGPMTQSKLVHLFDLQGDTATDSKMDIGAERGSLFELYKGKSDKGYLHGHQAKKLPSLDALIVHLDTQCGAIFGGVAETQRRNVRFGPPVPLVQGIPECMDMRLLDETDGSS